MPPRRRARRPAVELSQEEQQDRNIRRRVNADRRAARHANVENSSSAR